MKKTTKPDIDLVSLLPREEQWLAEDNATYRRLVAEGGTHTRCPFCGKYLATLRLLALRAESLESGIRFVSDSISLAQSEAPSEVYDSQGVEFALSQNLGQIERAGALATDLKRLLRHERQCNPLRMIARRKKHKTKVHAGGRAHKAKRTPRTGKR